MERSVTLLEGERIDDLQRNGLCIIQNTRCFCFGMDAVLLSGFIHCAEGAKLLDLGTGNGILPLLLSAKTGAAELYGLEIQENIAKMAGRSVLLNGLQEKVHIVTGDIRKAGSIFSPASFDVVTSNPPYIRAGAGLINPADSKAIARHEILCTLEDVICQAAGLLRTGGSFFMVHRPDRLTDAMCLLRQYKLEPKRLRIVYPYVNASPNMFLIEAVRGGRSGLNMENPLILQEEDGSYTEEVREKYGF